MAEATGVSGKQAYKIDGGATPKAYAIVVSRTEGAAISILTATTTVVATGKGHLNHLLAVGGTLGNVTVYDNTAASGTVLFGPATPVAGGLVAADIDFTVGLTVVTAAATALQGSYRQ